MRGLIEEESPKRISQIGLRRPKERCCSLHFYSKEECCDLLRVLDARRRVLDAEAGVGMHFLAKWLRELLE